MNLVKTMSKRELWDYIKTEDPVFCDLLKDFSNSDFGKVDLVEYNVEGRE